MADAGIIRNQLKIDSTISNAQVVCDMHDKGETLDHLMWQFVDHQPLVNPWQNMGDVPASTPTAEAMSKALKKRGFRFVGPTVIYAHMQATGMVNDHLVSCHRHMAVR